MLKFFRFMFCFFFLFNIFLWAEEPLLVLVIMVKNEAPVMQKTLQPFLNAGHQQYVILDTGSTDDTIKITRNLFKKYNIEHGHIVEQPFVNFEISRNYALECAEKLFPNAVFFLMIDAEWYMHNVEGLLEFCKKYQHHNAIAYLIKKKLLFRQSTDYINYLFKAHQGVRFLGAVHEMINKFAEIKVPDDVWIVHEISQTNRKKSSERWHRDLEILLKEHEKNPENLRTIFYLGQTYACLQQNEKAIFWYGKRCKSGRNNEEKYLAHYRIALLYEQMGNLPQALLFYFKAHHIRPQRIEPLVHIAQHFFNLQNYDAAFLLAKYITTLSVPHEEKLCLSPEMYEFALYDILAASAWHIGEYEIARQATLKALEYDPFKIRLQNKLRLYEDILNHKKCNLLHRNYWCQWCNGYFWLNRPAWFNFCCLAHGRSTSNRCNLANGVSWRYWVGPFIISPSKD